MINILRKTMGIVFTICTITAFSQVADYQPKSYIDEDGNIFWNKNLPIFIRISSTEDGKGTLLKSENPQFANPIYLDTEGTNYIRTRYAVDKETKKLIQPLAEVMMPIIADGIGPKSQAAFSGAPSYRKNNSRYFGKGLKISITSQDNASGLENLVFKLDQNDFTAVNGEFEIGDEGSHEIQFYGVDKVGNKEETRSESFIVDTSPPEITHNINGFADDNVIAETSKIYFTSTDALSGVQTIYYRFDDEEFKQYNGSEVRFSYLDDGNHVLEFYAVDQVSNKSENQTVSFYLDKTAPLTASDVLGDRFVVNDRIYFSGRTKMKLTAVDNKIGVKEIRYSIDNGPFEIYDQPFYLPSIPGEHSIRFYSVDRLANEPSGSEKYKHNISLIYLDLNGPRISSTFDGPVFEMGGTQFIGPTTRISIEGRDGESGVQYLAYSINGEQVETNYNEPFTLDNAGKFSIELFGYDNVNNRNIGNASFIVDANAPEIIENFSTEAAEVTDNIPVYPPYITVYLAATDDLTGSDKIYYRINGGREILYSKPISGFKKETEYRISVRAVDKVGNESTKSFTFMTNAD